MYITTTKCRGKCFKARSEVYHLHSRQLQTHQVSDLHTLQEGIIHLVCEGDALAGNVTASLHRCVVQCVSLLPGTTFGGHSPVLWTPQRGTQNRHSVSSTRARHTYILTINVGRVPSICKTWTHLSATQQQEVTEEVGLRLLPGRCLGH
jgi:hypothetical protein